MHFIYDIIIFTFVSCVLAFLLSILLCKYIKNIKQTACVFEFICGCALSLAMLELLPKAFSISGAMYSLLALFLGVLISMYFNVVEAKRNIINDNNAVAVFYAAYMLVFGLAVGCGYERQMGFISCLWLVAKMLPYNLSAALSMKWLYQCVLSLLFVLASVFGAYIGYINTALYSTLLSLLSGVLIYTSIFVFALKAKRILISKRSAFYMLAGIIYEIVLAFLF